ncbi:MAG: hypothetical protein JWR80_2816 [Bradyrhizobium sp.]|nr:hypothetical protein [Bradyrhizobium sp.]
MYRGRAGDCDYSRSGGISNGFVCKTGRPGFWETSRTRRRSWERVSPEQSILKLPSRSSFPNGIILGSPARPAPGQGWADYSNRRAESRRVYLRVVFDPVTLGNGNRASNDLEIRQSVVGMSLNPRRKYSILCSFVIAIGPIRRARSSTRARACTMLTISDFVDEFANPRLQRPPRAICAVRREWGGWVFGRPERSLGAIIDKPRFARSCSEGPRQGWRRPMRVLICGGGDLRSICHAIYKSLSPSV